MLRAEAPLADWPQTRRPRRVGWAVALFSMPNSDEPHVLRGELRAAVGRWREALADFDVVLRGPRRGKRRHSARQPTLKRRDAWNARCGAEPWPAAAWATTLARAPICAIASASFARPLRPRGGPPAW